MSQATPTVFVLGLTATGLAVARDVAPHGWRVVGVDADRTRPGCYSRHVQELPHLSRLPLGLGLVDALLDAAAQMPVPPIVVPAADDAVQWCITHRKTLMPRVAVSAGLMAESAGVMLDKSAFGLRCAELGIDVPLTVQPSTMADVHAFVAQAGLPCIVKPRAGHLWRQRLRGQKLLVPKTLAELERALTDTIGDISAVVLQELVPGPESNLLVGAVLSAEEGGVRAVVTGRKIRQFPRDFGSGSLVRTEQLPEVARLSADIIERLDYRGVCGTEFKLDPRTGRLRLIEINPRPTLWYDLCRAAGSHLIWAHVQALAGALPPPPAAQRQEVTWRYLVRDALALAGAGPAALAASLRSEPRADTDAVFAWDDPLSGAASVGHAAFQAALHLKPGRTH